MIHAHASCEDLHTLYKMFMSIKETVCRLNWTFDESDTATLQLHVADILECKEFVRHLSTLCKNASVKFSVQ